MWILEVYKLRFFDCETATSHYISHKTMAGRLKHVVLELAPKFEERVPMKEMPILAERAMVEVIINTMISFNYQGNTTIHFLS